MNKKQPYQLHALRLLVKIVALAQIQLQIHFGNVYVKMAIQD